MATTRAPRRTSQDRKLDELILLSRQRDQQLADLSTGMARLSATVAEQAEQLAAMQPTVNSVAEALTFAKVGKTFLRFFMGIGVTVLGFVWWMDGRWQHIANLFKRLP